VLLPSNLVLDFFLMSYSVLLNFIGSNIELFVLDWEILKSLLGHCGMIGILEADKSVSFFVLLVLKDLDTLNLSILPK